VFDPKRKLLFSSNGKDGTISVNRANNNPTWRCATRRITNNHHPIPSRPLSTDRQLPFAMLSGDFFYENGRNPYANRVPMIGPVAGVAARIHTASKLLSSVGRRYLHNIS